MEIKNYLMIRFNPDAKLYDIWLCGDFVPRQVGGNYSTKEEAEEYTKLVPELRVEYTESSYCLND